MDVQSRESGHIQDVYVVQRQNINHCWQKKESDDRQKQQQELKM